MNKAFQTAESRTLSRHEVVTADGTVVHLITDGYIGLFSNIDGVRRLLFVYKQGDIFPFAVSTDMFDNRDYSYIALGPVLLKSMPRKAFDYIVAHDIAVAASLLTSMQEIMQLQFERINNLQKQQILERLLERLWFFTKRLGIKNSAGKVVFDVAMSHVDLASSIGTSRETVTRYMKQLESEGILTVRHQRITIVSTKKLEEAMQQKRLPLKKNWGKVPIVALQAGLALQGTIIAYSELLQ